MVLEVAVGWVWRWRAFGLKHFAAACNCLGEAGSAVGKGPCRACPWAVTLWVVVVVDELREGSDQRDLQGPQGCVEGGHDQEFGGLSRLLGQQLFADH